MLSTSIPYTARNRSDSVLLQKLKEAAEKDPAKMRLLNKLGDATSAFESLFISQMMKTMRATIPENSLIDGGLPEKFFRQMQDEALADEFARNNMLGIGDMLFRSYAETMVLGRSYADIASTEAQSRNLLGHKELEKAVPAVQEGAEGHFSVKKAEGASD